MTANKPPSSAPVRRLSRRAALRPDRLLAALPPLAPPPPTGLRPAEPSLVQGGDPSLPPLSVIVYNRLAFGPRPGDLAAFNALGPNDDARLTSWVDTQLNPNAIVDTGCDAIIAGANLPSLNKSLTQLWTDHYLGNQSRTQPISDVRTATFLRAVHSSRQFKEVMVDFWHNHFSVYAWDYSYASATWVHYDRDVIRANALGNFRTLLGSVARSPAMLFYLDNYISSNAGPNENYARESFELHTLGSENYLGVVTDPDTIPTDINGVAIGYCDSDVYESSRAFTGWRVNNGYSGAPGNDGNFLYQDTWHDRFQKVILAKHLLVDAPPLQNGNDVHDLLAFHPGTARFIARKLCRRLIADDPPQSIIDAAANVFFTHHDDPDQIKVTVRTILLSDEFKETWGQKVKRPFEAAAGILRATNASFTKPNNTFWYYYESAGQALFSRRSPDGYPDKRFDWSNTSALMQRWRFANYLVQGYLGSASVNLLSQMPGGYNTANAIADFWIDRLLGRPMDPPGNRDAVVDFMAQGFNANNPLPSEDIANRLPYLVALILMAPDFQWR